MVMLLVALTVLSCLLAVALSELPMKWEVETRVVGLTKVLLLVQIG